MNFALNNPLPVEWAGQGILQGQRRTIAVCLLLLAFVGWLVRSSAEPITVEGAAEPPPVRVYILAGQSNAEGFAHLQQYREGREPFPEAWKEQRGVHFWLGADSSTPRNDWTYLHVMDSGRFGPEIGFGLEMARLSSSRTGELAVIKYASGGTGIARSQDYTDYIPSLAGFDDHGRNWHPPRGGVPAGNLYAGLLRNVRASLDALTRSGRRWELAGFIWMQGEHEAGISRKMAEDYGRLLSEFIRAVRKDLNAPRLPVVVGEINSHSWAFGEIARREQLKVCREEPGVSLVTTVDLPRIPGDGAHFTADGMLTLGRRFGAAFLEPQ